MKTRHPHLLAAALLALLTLAAFHGVSHNGFVSFDDTGYLTKNPVVARGLTWRGVLWAATTTHQANWHPVTWLSHMGDVALFGMRPGAHHLVSLALHVANTLLLLLLLLRLTGNRWRSALVAALFAVHPLHVESVAWAAERKDVLSTLFALGAMLVYARAARRGAVLRSAALPTLFALALMSKPMPVSLPFLLLLLDGWPLGRWAPSPASAPRASAAPFARRLPPAHLWLEKLPLFLLSAVSAGITLYAQRAGGALIPVEHLPLPLRGVNALLSSVRYLGKALWPRTLLPFYPHPEGAGPWWVWCGALLLLAALSALALRARRPHPWLTVGWAWYLGTLAPVIGIVQVGTQAMADRYTYLPLTGIFIAASWTLARFALGRRSLRAAWIAGPAAVLLLAALAGRQVGLWKDDRTLFTHVERADPGNWIAISALGDAAERAGDHFTALVYYQRVLALRPESPNPLNNIGNVLAALGRRDEAEAYYRRAISARSESPVSHFNLANILQEKGRLAEAEAHYRATLRVNPLFLPAHTGLGLALAAEGRFGEAAAAFRQALELDPAVPDGHFNLALALARGGDDAAAVAVYGQALAAAPADAEVRARYGESLARLGRRAEAADAFRRALVLDPGLAIARTGLDGLGRPPR